MSLPAPALDTLALWLSTYLLHSTLLLGCAWLLRRLSPAALEGIWRTAMLGALLTTTIHVGTGFRPIPGHLHLFVRAEAAPGTAHAAPDPTATAASPRATRDAGSAQRPLAPSSAAPSTLERSSRRTTLTHLPVIAWALAALAALALVSARQLRFAARLRHRRDLDDEEVRAALAGLIERSGIGREPRLTTSERIQVPHARGWLRPEICLPGRACREMDAEQIEAVLAHELAHLERRDPAWQALTRTIAGALFFQPLNHRACLELEEWGEMRCDARAAELTGHPIALARSLAAVAGWSLESGRLGAPALASRRGTLRARIARLLSRTPAPRPASRWAHALAATPIALVLALTPTLAAPPPAPQEPLPWQPPAAVEPARTETAQVPALVLPLPRFATRQPQPTTAPRPAARPTPEHVELAVRPIAEPTPETAPAPQPPPEAPEAPPAPAEEPTAADEIETDVDIEELEEAELEALEDELDAELDAIEDELEGAFEELEDAIEEQMDVVEDAIESGMETLEDEIEGSMESFEEEMERLAERLQQTDDEAERRDIEAQMAELGRTMGALGAKVGEIVGEAMGGDLQVAIQDLVSRRVVHAERLAETHAAFAERMAEQYGALYESGERPSQEELDRLREEARRLATELAPQREEIQRLAEELRTELEPTRERIEQMQQRLRAELEQWRQENAETLDRLERQRAEGTP